MSSFLLWVFFIEVMKEFWKRKKKYEKMGGGGGQFEGKAEVFNGNRVSVLQDAKSSGEGLQNPADGLNATELYTST